MVTLHYAHPGSLDVKLRKKLGDLSLRERGFMREFITAHVHDIRDRVYWLEREGKPFAWAIRAYNWPYIEHTFLVYVNRNQRKKGWGKYLHQQALKYSKCMWNVYGQHSTTAKKFYRQLGYLEEEML